jgi:hypothetical protein
MRRREKVHGLYILVPLRDYHLAYILSGLRLLEEEHKARGLKGSVRFIQGLQDHIRKYFAELIRQTKIMRRYLDHIPLFDEPPIEERPLPHPVDVVFKDPYYRVSR